MPASNKDIESASGYGTFSRVLKQEPSHQLTKPSLSLGSIPTSEEARTVEQADAEEGPFPVDIKSMLIAEFFGTCVYVQLGVAAECAALYTKSSVPLSVVWGAAFTLGIYVSAALSGGHLNPALTFSFALVRPADFRFRKLLPYWIAQYLGAFAAGAINLFLFHRAIGHFEKKSGIIRGTMQGIESAAAFGDYFTYDVIWWHARLLAHSLSHTHAQSPQSRCSQRSPRVLY